MYQKKYLKYKSKYFSLKSQYGGGSGEDNNMPSPKQIAAGSEHFLALMDDGSVYAWGKNSEGQLGLGHKDNIGIPTKIPDLGKVKSIFAFGSVSLAIMEENAALYYWGGIANRSSTYTKPIQMSWRLNVGNLFQPLHGVKSIITDENNFYVLQENGSLYTWGINDYGQHGKGEKGDKYVYNHLLSINLNKVKNFTIKSQSCFAITEDNKLYVWGRNDNGQLGLGHTNDVLTPEPKEFLFPQEIESQMDKLKQEVIQTFQEYINKIKLQHDLVWLLYNEIVDEPVFYIKSKNSKYQQIGWFLYMRLDEFDTIIRDKERDLKTIKEGKMDFFELQKKKKEIKKIINDNNYSQFLSEQEEFSNEEELKEFFKDFFNKINKLKGTDEAKQLELKASEELGYKNPKKRREFWEKYKEGYGIITQKAKDEYEQLNKDTKEASEKTTENFRKEQEILKWIKNIYESKWGFFNLLNLKQFARGPYSANPLSMNQLIGLTNNIQQQYKLVYDKWNPENYPNDRYRAQIIRKYIQMAYNHLISIVSRKAYWLKDGDYTRYIKDSPKYLYERDWGFFAILELPPDLADEQKNVRDQKIEKKYMELYEKFDPKNYEDEEDFAQNMRNYMTHAMNNLKDEHKLKLYNDPQVDGNYEKYEIKKLKEEQ